MAGFGEDQTAYRRPLRAGVPPLAGGLPPRPTGAAAGFALVLMVDKIDGRTFDSTAVAFGAAAVPPRAMRFLPGVTLNLSGVPAPCVWRLRSPAARPPASDEVQAGIKGLSPLPIKSPRAMLTSASRRIGQLAGSW